MAWRVRLWTEDATAADAARAAWYWRGSDRAQLRERKQNPHASTCQRIKSIYPLINSMLCLRGYVVVCNLTVVTPQAERERDSHTHHDQRGSGITAAPRQ
jgi:hypothetical protein